MLGRNYAIEFESHELKMNAFVFRKLQRCWMVHCGHLAVTPTLEPSWSEVLAFWHASTFFFARKRVRGSVHLRRLQVQRSAIHRPVTTVYFGNSAVVFVLLHRGIAHSLRRTFCVCRGILDAAFLSVENF